MLTDITTDNLHRACQALSLLMSAYCATLSSPHGEGFAWVCPEHKHYAEEALGALQLCWPLDNVFALEELLKALWRCKWKSENWLNRVSETGGAIMGAYGSTVWELGYRREPLSP